MNNLFQENKNSFLFLLGLFFILSIVLFFTFVRPLGKELKKQELAVSSLETEVSVLEVKATKLSEMTIDTSSLEKQLPLNRDLKKLLLSLKDVEKASESHIDSIRLNYG